LKNLNNFLTVVFFVAITSCKTTTDYKKLPKVELHLHLDCSLSYEVVKQLKPSISRDAYQESFMASPKSKDLVDYIKKADNAIELMQTKEQLRLVTLDLFKQLKADHVIYAEIRFAPLLHLKQGLTAIEVVQTVNDSAEEGIKLYGVEAGVILCTLRHYSEAQSMETVELAEKFKGTHIVGFDIAGDEAGFPIDQHLKSFEYARANNIPCTAHAGEAKGAGSVWETLKNLKPSRVGHGVRSIEDSTLITFLKAKNIHLEICLTSNLRTNIYRKLKTMQSTKFMIQGYR